MADLIRVVAPYFVAGLEIERGVCISAAPILDWAVGKTDEHLRAYFARKKWSAETLPPSTPRTPP